MFAKHRLSAFFSLAIAVALSCLPPAKADIKEQHREFQRLQEQRAIEVAMAPVKKAIDDAMEELRNETRVLGRYGNPEEVQALKDRLASYQSTIETEHRQLTQMYRDASGYSHESVQRKIIEAAEAFHAGLREADSIHRQELSRTDNIAKSSRTAALEALRAYQKAVMLYLRQEGSQAQKTIAGLGIWGSRAAVVGGSAYGGYELINHYLLNGHPIAAAIAAGLGAVTIIDGLYFQGLFRGLTGIYALGDMDKAVNKALGGTFWKHLADTWGYDEVPPKSAGRYLWMNQEFEQATGRNLADLVAGNDTATTRFRIDTSCATPLGGEAGNGEEHEIEASSRRGSATATRSGRR